MVSGFGQFEAPTIIEESAWPGPEPFILLENRVGYNSRLCPRPLVLALVRMQVNNEVVLDFPPTHTPVLSLCANHLPELPWRLLVLEMN